MSSQALNSEHCNCMGIAQVETNAQGEEVVVGCNPAAENIACPQPHWTAGAGQFVIDFFTPETIDALGSLFTGNPSNQTLQGYYGLQQEKNRTTGIIIGGLILIVVLILMYRILISK
jgi:hypothetical protein